jgi:hypothetical protein
MGRSLGAAVAVLPGAIARIWLSLSNWAWVGPMGRCRGVASLFLVFFAWFLGLDF